MADMPEVDNVLKPDKEFVEKKIYQRALKKLKAVSEKSKKAIEKIAEKKKEAEKKLEQVYRQQLEPYADRANTVIMEELRAMGYRGEARPSMPYLARVQQKEPESAKIDFNEILRSVGSVNLDLGSIDDIVGINEVDYSSVFDTKKKSVKKKPLNAVISDLVYGNKQKESNLESKSTDFDLDVSELVFGKRKI